VSRPTAPAAHFSTQLRAGARVKTRLDSEFPEPLNLNLETLNPEPKSPDRKDLNMKRIRTVPAALAVLLLLSFAVPAAAQTSSAKIATANPARIFNEIQETKDLQAKFNADLGTLNEQRKQKELQINDTKAARDSLKPDTAQWSERNQELVRLAVEYEAWQKIVQADLERQQKMQMRAIFDRITETVGQVATTRQIDLVIAEVRPELPESLDQMNTNDLRARLISRNVLFSVPQVDISNDVIAAMDAKYKGGGTGTTAAPPR
jgi:Skp family chaperone for outer membrane proteins